MNNSLLDNEIIKQFDYLSIRKKINLFISAIDILCFRLKNMEKPKITPSYEIKYSSCLPVNSSKIESFVINKLYLEEDINMLLSKYILAVNSLNDLEREVFIKTYIYNVKEDILAFELKYSEPKILQIKKSASIKFSISTDLENLKLLTD